MIIRWKYMCTYPMPRDCGSQLDDEFDYVPFCPTCGLMLDRHSIPEFCPDCRLKLKIVEPPKDGLKPMTRRALLDLKRKYGMKYRKIEAVLKGRSIPYPAKPVCVNNLSGAHEPKQNAEHIETINAMLKAFGIANADKSPMKAFELLLAKFIGI